MKPKRFMSTKEAEPSDQQHTTPCVDCPWRRNAVPGWTGTLTPEDWLREAHDDGLIFCHTQLGPQCAGAAIFRANVCKVPRTQNALRLSADRKKVFSCNDQFLAYHKEKK